MVGRMRIHHPRLALILGTGGVGLTMELRELVVGGN